MKTSDEPEPPRAARIPASARAEKAPGSVPRLIHRQRKISADWQEVEAFLRCLPVALAPSPYSVCLVSDRAIRRYNQRFRKKNEATDVLSFPMGPAQHRPMKPGLSPQGEEDYLGDILISVETAEGNAARFRLRLEDEIKTLILHGLLHLLGQDHERDNGQMARNERRWAARLGLRQNLLGRKPGARRARRLPLRRGSAKPSRQRLR